MKILLAAPEDKTVLGMVGSYCKKALEHLGCEVFIFDFRQHPYTDVKIISFLKSLLRPFFPSSASPYDISVVKSLTDRKINRMLLECILKFKPDILLVLLGENILPRTVAQIKDSGVVTVNWLHDTLLLSYRYDFLRSVCGAYNHLFIVDSSEILKRLDITDKCIETLVLGCDPDVHSRIDLSEEEKKMYGCDVAFVGTVTVQREEILEELAEFDLKIWGRWQTRSSRLKASYQKKDIYDKEAVKIYNAAKIVLDIHGRYGIEKEIFNVTPRVFEVPASGGFLLTNHIPQLCEFYKVGEEIITYKDREELKYLIRYYLGHPQERQAIVERGYQRAHQEHTYVKRLDRLLESVKKN